MTRGLRPLSVIARGYCAVFKDRGGGDAERDSLGSVSQNSTACDRRAGRLGSRESSEVAGQVRSTF